MEFKILDGHSNYAAQPVKLKHFYPIKGADKIIRTVVFGNDVVIAKDSYKEGDTVLYFRSGTRLSKDLCKFNNLYESAEQNLDKEQKGYISFRTRRVKAIKLRGVISDGMLLPLTSLYLVVPNTDIFKIKKGNDFNELNDILICDKYEVVITQKVNMGGSKEPKNKFKYLLVDNQLKFHRETSHLAKNLHKLSLDSNVVITEKFHGSSVILSKVKVKKKLTWFEKLLQKYLKIEVVDTEYKGIWSSGKPKSNLPKGIEGMWANNKEDIWEKAWNDYSFAVEPGISIYGELCNAGIQKGYDYSKFTGPLQSKDYKFVIYRITRTNDLGITDEFNWEQVEEYCNKYGLSTVPTLYKGKLVTDDISTVDKAFDKLQEIYLEKKQCEYCVNNVPNEGICVRVDYPMEIFKLKSKLFIYKENDAQEAGETNLEDQQ